jgi:hypothetical protein
MLGSVWQQDMPVMCTDFPLFNSHNPVTKSLVELSLYDYILSTL